MTHGREQPRCSSSLCTTQAKSQSTGSRVSLYSHSPVRRSWYDQSVEVTFHAALTRYMLGEQYKIPSFCGEALFRIRAAFPDSLDRFDYYLHRRCPSPPLIDVNLRDAIAIVQLVRLYNIPNLAPIAFYVLAQLRGLDDVMSPVVYTAAHEELQLDMEAVPEVLDMHQKVYVAQAELMQLVSGPELGEGCTTGDDCIQSLLCFFQAFVGMGMCNGPGFDVFRDNESVVDDIKGGILPEERWCDHCDARLKERLRTYRVEQWDYLIRGVELAGFAP